MNPDNAKPRFNPVFKQPTPDLSQPKPSTTPSPELQQLDGQALSGVNPEANIIGDAENITVTPAKDHLTESERIEFMLHEDGLMMKAVPRPGYEPQFILIDGKGQIFGFARNKEVAHLICNAVNILNHAQVQNMAADKAVKQEAADMAKANITGSKIILPPNINN